MIHLLLRRRGVRSIAVRLTAAAISCAPVFCLLGCSTPHSVSASTATQTPIPQTTTRIVVDATAGRHPISPYIYGLAFTPEATMRDLRTPVNRVGGDSTSAYNWQQDARAAGQDWFFESIPMSGRDPDHYDDRSVADDRAAGTQAMLTVPMIGWVAKLGPGRSKLASFSILKYGLQQKTDVVGFAAAGNGVALNGTPIRNNDPNDAHLPDSLDRECLWVKHLVATWKPASAGGVQFYLLDNEPAQWHFVHRDIHPQGAHAAEIATKSIAFAKMIHSVDPSARVVGPEEWVPRGFHDSGFDQQRSDTGNKSVPSDRSTQTGGMDYLPWLLSQWKAAGRPVDIVSIHVYPDGGENSDDNSVAMQLLRNRSTRLLWDTSYAGGDSMRDIIGVIPRLRNWVDRYYVPGTPTAITEYNWGGEATMNGATTQADILGIFGREGLYMATRWIAPKAGTPVYLAYKLLHNADGHASDHASGFGDTSVSASAPDADRVSAFAAIRDRSGDLTVLLINKQLSTASSVDVDLRHFACGGGIETDRLVLGRIETAPPTPCSGNVLHETLPAQSATLLVVKKKGGRDGN